MVLVDSVLKKQEELIILLKVTLNQFLFLMEVLEISKYSHTLLGMSLWFPVNLESCRRFLQGQDLAADNF